MEIYSNHSISRLTALLSTTLLTLCLPLAAIIRVNAQSLEHPLFFLQADVLEENRTGIFTARGHVLFRYPQQQIKGTAEEAEYFSEEQKLVMMGTVRLNQRGELIRDSQVICLLKVGRCMPLTTRILI